MTVQIVKRMDTYSHSISSTPRISSGMSPSSSNADIPLLLCFCTHIAAPNSYGLESMTIFAWLHHFTALAGLPMVSFLL